LKRSTQVVILSSPWYLFLFGNAIVPLVSAGSHHFFFALVRALYAFNTIVWPVSLLAAGTVVLTAIGLKRGDRSLARYAWASLILAVIVIGVRINATHIEPHRLILHTVPIETPKAARPIDILHISDIQSDRIGPYEDRVFARIRELNPDLILFTGDLLQPISPSTVESEIPKIAALFQTLIPPLGLYGVYGNVDDEINRFSVDDLGGLRLLESETADIDCGGFRIKLAGLSLNQSFNGANEFLQEWLDASEKNDFTIVMGHSPDYSLSAKDLPIDLCLAGHTHGGQIVIPGFGPPVTLSRVPRSWARGYRKVGKTRLNVSAGIGSEHAAGLPPIRFFCPPDITLLELTPAISKP